MVDLLFLLAIIGYPVKSTKELYVGIVESISFSESESSETYPIATGNMSKNSVKLRTTLWKQGS